ncbi:putative Blue copper protein [Melia azedarach]|uniref:Blue copper protein n=1 Tax=Melia azedarach TaxID=155640 RepID=A0ACC1WQK2_MELAZ|nr:putative Blue copper protein [Melia azedarach]
MARAVAGAVCVVLVFCMVVPSLATVYTVGESSGWTMGADYSTWTSGKTFAVGDSLVFNYGSGHTVDEVSASDYKSCTVGNAITSDNSGATTVALKTAGTHYFICGVAGHCGNGMKLAVTVAAGSPTTPSGSPTTPSSSAGGSTSTSPPSGRNTTTNTPSSTIPESSSGADFSPLVAIVITFVSFFVLVLHK